MNTTETEKQLGTYSLFLSVILIWGLSWPLAKMGLANITPLWFAAWRQGIAAVGLTIYLLITRQFRFPSRQDMPILLTSGIFFAGLFLAFINLGLMHVHAGRASLLAYTTPFWVILLSWLFLKRKPSKEQWIGFIFGIAGIAILFNPMSFDWSNRDVLIGNGFLLLAALSWSIVIIHSKEHKWHHTPLQIVPWQMLIAVILLSILAMFIEPHAKITWTPTFAVNLAFLGLISSGYGFVISMLVSKRLNSVTTSLGFLGVPISGIFFSLWLLGEKINLVTGFAVILILIGLMNVALGERRARKLAAIK